MHIHVYMYMHLHSCLYWHLSMYLCIHISPSLTLCLSRACLSVHMICVPRVCECTVPHIHTQICLFIKTYRYLCLCLCTYISMCMYLYMHMYILNCTCKGPLLLDSGPSAHRLTSRSPGAPGAPRGSPPAQRARGRCPAVASLQIF